ncbi:MAG: class I SAM-dependent methyltransferase [Desulfurococcales archaeon]|nr:class I SAM-dependent methyltransferase [Desulfurococcales archaeon]
MAKWYEEFFDRLYYETYRVFEDEERNEREARFIVEALGLPRGSLILDLACGYARHAVYLAKWGYHVTCLDLSDYLLERARERVERFQVDDMVEVVKGDMRKLDYDSELDGAYNFFTSFGFFSDDENFKVLEGVARALKPGGVFLLDLWNPIQVIYNAYIHNGPRRTWHEAGGYIILEEVSYDLYNARLNAERTFYKDSMKPVATRRFTVRFYMYWEIRDLLDRTGMAIERVYGSYKGEEYSYTSPRMIIVARRTSTKQASKKPI